MKHTCCWSHEYEGLHVPLEDVKTAITVYSKDPEEQGKPTV